ncbi:hypothetical protein [Streptomyces sp. NBC_01363]|uniref:hypothetical protein n=1 Tax=Streptomyces sp. NBC_01363 TaxID=2903840 RepID=UPI00224EC7E6|nr:hypothetical protein [Streptomyces sp. NBC_01363]MCX4730448.1 hypothetical protein [Streptomyces sp. NBC_01363]
MRLQKLIKRLRKSDRQTALSALSALEEGISPQGAAFTEEAVTAIPMLFDAATRSETRIRSEILNYLGSAYADTLGTWRFRWDEDPDTRHHFTEMVSWEQAISESYWSCAPSVVPLLGAEHDEAVRGSAVFLLSRIKESGPELMPTLQRVYDEQVGEPLRIDIIEGIANLTFTQRPVRVSDLQWLHEKLNDSSPAIRLGAALSLMAREGQVEGAGHEDDGRSPLKRIALDARAEGESALRQTAWLAKKSTEWALERTVDQNADSGGTSF